MTSGEPIRSRSSTLEPSPTTLIRFNSARVSPEKKEDEIEYLVEPTLSLPSDLQLNEGLLHSNEFTPQSPLTKQKIYSVFRATSLVNDAEEKSLVKAFESVGISGKTTENDNKNSNSITNII